MLRVCGIKQAGASSERIKKALGTLDPRGAKDSSVSESDWSKLIETSLFRPPPVLLLADVGVGRVRANLASDGLRKPVSFKPAQQIHSINPDQFETQSVSLVGKL